MSTGRLRSAHPLTGGSRTKPRSDQPLPSEAYLDWHRREVFLKPARPFAAAAVIDLGLTSCQRDPPMTGRTKRGPDLTAPSDRLYGAARLTDDNTRSVHARQARQQTSGRSDI